MSNHRVTTDLRGHTVVEAHLPCINGLSAWVMVADLGKPYPEDEMFGGLDREAIGALIVAALNAPARGVPETLPPSSALRDAAYDQIDRFLRNNLDDTDYADYSQALDLICTTAPARGVAPSAPTLPQRMSWDHKAGSMRADPDGVGAPRQQTFPSADTDGEDETRL